MKIRMLFLTMIPCLMAVGCGLETEPEQDGLRAIPVPVEPCSNVDCGPMPDPAIDVCPEGTDLLSESECVDVDGECVWEIVEECVEVGGEPPPNPPPAMDPPPPPSQGPPRHIAPPHAG